MDYHHSVYRRAEAYDIAFDFRDIPRECNFMSKVFADCCSRPPTSFLELAAGPAMHAREYARRGLNVCALDLSPEMVEYGKQQAASRGIDFRYQCGDMREFDLEKTFDLAAILMDSTSYLLTNDDVLAHFDSVEKHLNQGGIYVLEMSHPRDHFGIAESTKTSWEMSRDNVKVETRWGKPDDKFDPISQITQTTVTMVITGEHGTETIKEVAPQRCITATEFDALVRASGCFKTHRLYGAMDSDTPFSNEKEAWRMTVVLQKS
jgi:SAM-dependent methyltransferase